MLCSFSALNLNPPSKKLKHTVRDPHPPSHRLLASFSVPRDLAPWKVFSDAAHGGTTAASLSPSRLFPGTAEFRGALACAGASGRARSGFAGMTVQLGGGEDDAEESPLGERTAASSSSSSGSGGDESRTDNGWTTAELPLSRFLLTHRGRLVEARVSMNAARVVSLGLAPAPLPPSPSTGDGNVETGGDGGEGGEEAPAEGAFCLGLDSITAVSTSRGLLTREEAEEAERAERDREREVGKT